MKRCYPTLPAILIVALATTVRGQETLPAPAFVPHPSLPYANPMDRYYADLPRPATPRTEPLPPPPAQAKTSGTISGLRPAEVVPPPAASAKTHGTVHAANEKLIRELIAILKKTKSPDTFVVTVKALADMGPRARAAVPAIILNAERLGLIKDILKQADDDEGDDPGDFIVEAIEQIVASRHRQGPHPVAPMAYPPGPIPPPPPCVVNPLMCPIGPALASGEVQPPKAARK